LSAERSLSGGRIGGNYQLLEQIGAGGMGVVYRAQQDHPVNRTVAIKLIKLGIDTPQLVARFQSERQALASLEHPGISRVYDAGTTDTGRPYFVMEYVAGRPITEYCDEKRFTTNRRLELFAQVCQAVQHAHYNGILHRDLKPSNMLVTEIDGQPQVKIIDFGIAKAIRGATAASPFATDAGQFVGTPVYTSPEQAAGEEVDTRADIYSLGVVLYELLSGALPFDVPDKSNSIAVARQITTIDPPKPSTRLSALGETATTLASLRGAANAATLRRQLRGDLDQIVMKALRWLKMCGDISPTSQSWRARPRWRTRRANSPAEIACS
jgi:serine/threonine protein kinase